MNITSPSTINLIYVSGGYVTHTSPGFFFFHISHVSLVLALTQNWTLVIECLFKYNLHLFSAIGLIFHVYLK